MRHCVTITQGVLPGEVQSQIVMKNMQVHSFISLTATNTPTPSLHESRGSRPRQQCHDTLERVCTQCTAQGQTRSEQRNHRKTMHVSCSQTYEQMTTETLQLIPTEAWQAEGPKDSKLVIPELRSGLCQSLCEPTKHARQSSQAHSTQCSAETHAPSLLKWNYGNGIFVCMYIYTII